jgi:hypothetical protein
MLKVPSLHFLLSKAPPTGVKGAPMKRPLLYRIFDLSLFFLPLLLNPVSNVILLINLVSLEDLSLALFLNLLTKIIPMFFLSNLSSLFKSFYIFSEVVLSPPASWELFGTTELFDCGEASSCLSSSEASFD